MDPREFHQDLRQQVLARADANGDFSEPVFAEIVTGVLLEDGSIASFEPCAYRQRGLKIDGYAFVPEEGTLDLFVVDYSNEEEPGTLIRKNLDQAFRRAESFFEKSLDKRFVNEIEVSHPAHGLARQILEEAESIKRVRFYLLTDALLSERIKEIPSKEQNDREWSYRVWDLDRIAKVMATGEPEEIVIDFVEKFGRGLRCLPAALENSDLQCFLTVIPGDWLGSIYDEWSGRLLEQNVRTFLQLKGGVNKGIRQTILKEPEHFFPYNNGISATAEEAELVGEGDVLEIRRLRNFQIVNGGQTTASLFNVIKKDKGLGVDKVRVQMKLTIVDPGRAKEMVPKISRYSNSQNKISDADFFSNHPFHVRMEGISRRLWAPAVGGSQIQTHWFYERARGQHANAQTHLSMAQKREFLLQNPKQQVITKTDLATCFNTFRLLPHEVRRGAQKNFGKFAEYINERWDKDENEFGEFWFQQAVAQAIVFRATEKLVQEAPWYASWGYRAAIVTYGIAALVQGLKEEGLALDLRRIWGTQQVSSAFREQMLVLGERIQAALHEGSERHGVANPQEWGKRPQCWEEISRLDFPILERFAAELIGLDDAKVDHLDGKRAQKLQNEAEAQIKVVGLGADFWAKVLEWGQAVDGLSPGDMQLLSVAASIPRRLPNTKQSLRLLEIETAYSSSQD
jgi:hypothetical protein